MKKNILIFIISVTGVFSCKQGSTSTGGYVDTGTVNSTRKYVYADSLGKRLIIHNSFPMGGAYTDSEGKKHPYAIFYTQVTNETTNPVELVINFPIDSLEFPVSSGSYMKFFIPSDSMTTDKESARDYGLPLQSFLDTATNRSCSLKRMIGSSRSIAFNILMVSNKGVGGVLRTGLSLKGQDLIYTVAAYKSIPGNPLIEQKEINCGRISVKNLVIKE